MRLPAHLGAACFVAGCAFAAFLTQPAAAATQAGTTITNTSTATYSDGTNSYTAQSNTVTTTVQNVPVLTISPAQASPGANIVSPGGTVTDTYTLTNAGNSSGYFALSGSQTTNEGLASGSATFVNYLVNVPGQTQQTFTTIAAVNTYLSSGNTSSTPFLIPNATGAPTAANQITIGVTYTANSGATGTVGTILSPTITQQAGTGTTAATSAAVIGTYSDTVTADARMDASVSIVAPTSSVLAAYTLRYNNGGNRPMVAVNRAGLPAGAGITGSGIVVTSALPQYPSGTSLSISGTPTFGTQPAGAQFIYSTDGINWTTTITGATYIGVFIPASALTGSFGASNPGSSQNSVTSAQAQLAFTFSLTSSSASGAANPTAVTDVDNSIYADSSGFIEGPGIAFQSVANTGSATASQTAPAIANTNGTLTGAGSAQSSAAALSSAVLNGPSGAAGATGSDGTTATDYTAISYTNGGTLLSAVTGSTVSVPASAAAITYTNTIQNTGNKDDVFTLSSTITTLPSGWTAQFQNTGGTTITTLAVASGATGNYKFVLTPPASVTTFNAYQLYDVPVVATSGNDNTKSNATQEDFFVGGYVKLTKTVAVASGQTCAAATTYTANAITAKPGDCIQYTVAYLNASPSGGTGSVGLTATTIVITENGAATGGSGGTAYANTWDASTNGLYAAPVDSGTGTVGGYTVSGTAPGSQKFTDSIATLAAGASGTVVFLVQVK